MRKRGQVRLQAKQTRDVAAAKIFFKKAIRHEGRPPNTITLDGYAASHRAVREMREEAPERRFTTSSLNNARYLHQSPLSPRESDN